MDYKKLAERILEKVGGKGNVESVVHCMTRLRFVLKDESQDQSVKISTVLGKLDEISNDPNIPVHARTLIWEVLSKLESI